MSHEAVERYVREAEAAEEMASRATSENERITWQDIALLWRDLAQRKLAALSRPRPRPFLVYARTNEPAGAPEFTTELQQPALAAAG